MKRAAPLTSHSGDFSSPASGSAPKQPRFFVSKSSAAAVTSPGREMSPLRSGHMTAYDNSAPRYKDEASEARLSPDDVRIQDDGEGDAYTMTEEDSRVCLILKHLS